MSHFMDNDPGDFSYQGGVNAYNVNKELAKKREDQGDRTNIQEILKQYDDPNHPLSFDDTMNAAMSHIKDEKTRSQFLDFMGKQEKQKQDQTTLTKRKEFYKKKGLDENLAYAPESAQANALKPPPRDALAEKVQFDIYKDAQKKASEGQSHTDLIEEIGNMRELSTKFQGPTASLTARTLGTEAHAASSQFEASSNLILEPIFKLYNPAGQLPQRKVEMLRTLLKPNWNDTQPVIDAKLNAIESLVKSKSNQAKKSQKLLSQYGGNIPPELYYAIEDEDIDLIDQALEIGLKLNNKKNPFGENRKSKKTDSKKSDELGGILGV